MIDYASKDYLKDKPEHKSWDILAAVLWALLIIVFNFM